ncbi:MAG: DNA-binding HxlR family transcriptional regulator, partial [Kiritimatiellia bacterium]
MDLVGERWTLLILRELVPGGRRYGDLHRSLDGITTNLLAKRLKHLEGHGVVVKRLLPPPASVSVYELTELGRELEPALLALGRFGGHWLTHRDREDRVDVRWL